MEGRIVVRERGDTQHIDHSQTPLYGPINPTISPQSWPMRKIGHLYSKQSLEREH